MLRYCPVIFSFFLTCSLTFSCQNKEEVQEAPENLIKQGQMIEALVGIHILEQQVSESKYPKAVKQDSFQVYRNEILANLGIDSAAYFSSYKYYTGQLDEFQEIMVAVADSIKQLRENATDNPASKDEDKE